MDNCLKYYFDVLNDIVYPDDRFISSVWGDQIYSKTPGIEIQLHSLGGDMINEHAKTIKWEINVEDLSYMVKKANKLGISGRSISRVYCEEDEEGKHYYFEVQAPKICDTQPLC
jgi:hypothetical protein